MKNLKQRLEHHKACEEGMAFALQHKTAEAAWEACPNPQWMLWVIDSAGISDARKNRQFAIWCPRRTPIGNGKTTWDLLTDERSRRAVEVAELFLEGKATEEELSAACSAARSAAYSAAYIAARSAAYSAARSAVDSAAYIAARSAAYSAARSAADSAARSAADSAAYSASRSAAWSAQAQALRQIYGNPFAAKRRKKLAKGGA